MVNTIFKGKCIIIGDSAVGKTSLISCFVEHKFPHDYLPTIGTNLYVKEVHPDQDTTFQLTCWDIAGEKKWTAMRTLYYKGASGVFVVGDVTRPETFTSIESYWLEDLKKYCMNIPVILLANKSDLAMSVDEASIHAFGKKIGAIQVAITSAKTASNVEHAFMTLVNEMLARC